jgi:hypothetical protein
MRLETGLTAAITTSAKGLDRQISEASTTVNYENLSLFQ